MNRRNCIFIAICFFTGICLFPDTATAEKTHVVVSIPPQKYFVDAIGKDFVKTTVIVTPSQSPADYEPSPAQMLQMANAELYFAIGVPFETAWLDKFAGVNPDMRIIRTDADIEKKTIDRYEIGHGRGHSAKKHDHDHGTLDPHIWLSPPLVKIQAIHYRNALTDTDPDNREFYHENYTSFVSRIDRLDMEFKSLFEKTTAHKKFLVFHPSWGYFADAYGLTQISIEIEGKTPKAREVKDLIAFAEKHRLRLIFVQPQFSTKHAEIIASEIGGRLVYADPLAENWERNLRSVAMSINASLK